MLKSEAVNRAKERRRILPLPKGEGGVRGNKTNKYPTPLDVEISLSQCK